MSGWIKSAALALAAIITAGVMSVATAQSASAEQAVSVRTTVVAEHAATFAQRTAARAYRAVKTRFTRDSRSSATTRPMTALARWQSLPMRLRAPIQGLYASGTAKVDDDGLVSFFTGANETAACLTIATGQVTAGPCGVSDPGYPTTLTWTYDLLIRSVQWFDAHSDIYDAQARSAALLTDLVESSTPDGTTAQFTSTAGAVADGTFILTVGSSCGTVVLPEHDPNGSTYTANLLHGTC